MAPPPTPDRTETLAPRGASPPVGAGAPGAALTLDSVGPVSTAIAAAAGPADDPERYEQVGEHARGGLGRVLRAVDRRLGRTVAVKELLRHDPSNEARFLREAMITARLEHPGIVPVHEAGRWPNGDPYYVMKLVEGRTLKALIAEAHTLHDRLGLVPHVIAVADAVGYAHSEGVIHRDLKPANVVVGGFGETIVVDWGLARDTRRDVPELADERMPTGGEVSTVSGKVVGTPAYMSPEQARGELVDERADVYALGAVLYEVLAGSPPHADETPQAVLDRVLAGPPRPLAALVAGVPRELATIVGKAMARSPADRYVNAAALAEDLRRYTTGKLVSAHSYSTWALVQRWLSRHRGMVAVAATSAIVLAAVGAASVRGVVAERNIARSQRALAEAALHSADKRKLELVLLQAQTALPRDPTAALAWLKAYDLEADPRGAVVDVIDEALALGVARHVFRPGDWVFDAQFTPDGTTVVAIVRDGGIRRYDVATGFTTELGHAPSEPHALVLSPDGELAITGGLHGEVIAWPLHGGAPRLLVDGRGAAVWRLQLAADGRVLVERERSAPLAVELAGGEPEPLASGPASQYAVARDDWGRVAMASANEVVAPTTTGTRALARLERNVARLALSPSGDVVLIHDGKSVLAVPFAGGPARTLAPYDGLVKAIAWAPDGHTVAFGGSRPEIVLVDTRGGAAAELRGHADAIYALAFTRDGASLLSASDDATARVWRLTDRSATVLRGHEDDVYQARFSADERSVVTSSLDGSVRVWPLDRARATAFVEGAPIGAVWLDGARALIRTPHGLARWDLTTGARTAVFQWAEAPYEPSAGVPSPDAAYFAAPAADGAVELLARGGARWVLRGAAGPISHVEFTRDTDWLYASSADGSLRRWPLTAAGPGAAERVMTAARPVRGFAIGRAGEVFAQAGDEAFAISPAGEVSRLGAGPAWCVEYAELDPVRGRAIMHRCDKSLALLDGDRVIELPTGGYAATRVAVSPDGGLLASGLGDRTVRVWSAVTGAVVQILRGHTDLVLDSAFAPDGRALATASYDKTLVVWDLATGRHRVLRGHTASVSRVAWRDASQLVSTSSDGTVLLWQAPSLAVPSSAQLRAQLDAATSARIELDRPSSGERGARGT